MSARLVGPPLAPIPFATVGDALRSAAQGASGLRFVDAREEERFVAWQEVARRARRVAAALLDEGLVSGDRVAMVLPTGLDFMDAFFGALLAGAVPVPLYPPVRLGRMDEYAASTARMLVASGARVVLTDRRIRLLLGRALDEVRPALGCRVVAELAARSNEAEVAASPDALGLIQFSSGSTEDPKPVALTHRNLLAQTTALKTLMPQRSGTHEKGCSWLPLYHDMGLIGGLLTAVTWPGELVLLPPELFLARPALWLRAISRHQATISPGPNFAYGLCLKRVRDEELGGVDLSSWTYATNGAEPISAAVMERFCERFGRFGFRREALLPVYGLSEASLAVTFSPVRPHKRVAHLDSNALARTGQVSPGHHEVVSVGVPVPGCQVEVRDEAGRVVSSGQVGRVFVQGPIVMREYFGRPDATGEALRDGWLDTGDLGFVDGGELHVCGRAKDVVIIRGANHAPQEFEDCLDGLDGVRAGCAVAVGWVPEDSHEEALLVIAELTPDAPPELAEQIASAIVARTNVRPHRVHLVEPGTLPRTSSGKLRRREALRRYLAGELTAPKSVNALTVGVELLRSAIAHARRNLS